MESRSAVLGSQSDNHGNYEKSDMKMGQKCDPPKKDIFKCRKYGNLTTIS